MPKSKDNFDYELYAAKAGIGTTLKAQRAGKSPKVTRPTVVTQATVPHKPQPTTFDFGTAKVVTKPTVTKPTVKPADFDFSTAKVVGKAGKDINISNVPAPYAPTPKGVAAAQRAGVSPYTKPIDQYYVKFRGGVEQVAKLQTSWGEAKKSGDPAAIHNVAINVLRAYKLEGDTYDLRRAAKSNIPMVHEAMKVTFNLSDGDVKAYATEPKGLTILDYNKKIIELNRQGKSQKEIDKHMGINYYIKPMEVSPEVYANLTDEGREYCYPKLSMWQSLTPWKEELGEKQTVAGSLLMGAELIIPGVYIGRHWGKLSPGWKAGGIALDIACFIPFINVAAWAGRAGAVPIKAGARLTRLQSMMPRPMRTLGTAAVAEIKSPVTTIAHPIETAKSVIYPFETLIRPKKIPVAALEIRTHTVKLPVAKLGKTKSVMEARNKLTELAMKGEGATIQIEGKRVALTPTALQRSVGVAAVHSTTDIRPYLHGTTIQAGREGGLFLSPSLHTRFTYASAFGDLPSKGAMPGAIIIRDPRIVASLRPSGKLYRGAAEIEELLEAGYKLPSPSQLLITRDPSGRKLTLAIIGDPLTKKEIAKLKLLGVADTLKDIYAPAVKVGAATDLDDLVEMGSKLKILEAELKVARKAKRLEDVARLEKEIANLNEKAMALARRIDIASAGRRPLVPIGIGKGDYIATVLYNEYANRDPKQLAAFIGGLSRARRDDVLDRLGTRVRARVNRELRRLPERARYPRTLSTLRVVAVPGRSKVPTRGVLREIRRATTRVPPRATSSRKPLRVPREPRALEVPRVPVMPVLPHTADEGAREKIGLGSFAWRQGFGWWILVPPYRGRKDMIFSRTRPSGAREVTGPQSAYKTITRLGVNVPEGALLDLGIMDIEIKSHGGKIKYKRDIKQRTKRGHPVGMPPGVGGMRRG